MRNLVIALGLIFIVVAALAYSIGSGWLGRHEGPGIITAAAIPDQLTTKRAAIQKVAALNLDAATDKQILFGDLHVHTTISVDAFNASLPVLYGDGAHPLGDACDYARYCSALDFWSINDHAFSITPRFWRETVDSIRQCNAVANDPENPDVVAFLGWEWTQGGLTPDTHYGHKNVIIKDLEEALIPKRPIMAGKKRDKPFKAYPKSYFVEMALLGRDQRYLDFARYQQELDDQVWCPTGNVTDLPENCMEQALTPNILFDKLDQWQQEGVESMVIPHGTAWGASAPPGAKWDNQIGTEMQDPDRQFLVEAFSGHGNSEEYRDWRAYEYDEKGNPVCPAPTDNFKASCWRAGEIIEQRCLSEGLSAEECTKRAVVARARYIEGGAGGHMTVPGARVEDWLDAGQCRDCYLPTFNHRPGNSVQYMMARRNFDDPDNPKRFSFGVIAASDNHSARPGTGYKEINRTELTDSWGVAKKEYAQSTLAPYPFGAPKFEAKSESIPFSEVKSRLRNIRQSFEVERRSSFLGTGGLAAVHTTGRSRDEIWNALQRREVYGTSGDRMLLWFDLLNGGVQGNEVKSMGAELPFSKTPKFKVRAVGAFKQLPGCPDYSIRSLDSARLDRLCQGECYNPSDERKLITRIEVIRVRPQISDDEKVASLIEDPWKVLECDPTEAGCSVDFEDPEFRTSSRDALYYVRAIQEPTPTINGDNLRCEYNEEGICIKVTPCYGDYRTDFEDDCQAMREERAWSSPIYLEHYSSNHKEETR